MATEEYDVCIVGGGPAGSNAARIIKENSDDLSVVLFERGEEPTANCAGGIGLPLIKHLGIKPPDDIIKSPIRDVVLASPNEEAKISIDDIDIDTDSYNWIPEDTDSLGWVLDRQAWDNYQLELAVDAGVDVRTKHTVKSVEQNGSVETSVLDRDENEEITVESSFVGLANGPSWDLAVDAGFDSDTLHPPESELHMGKQYHMKDPEYMDEYGWDTIYMRFDRDYAPSGYTWSFPEGKTHTRWGNGVPLDVDANGSELLDEYLKERGKYPQAEDAREVTQALIPTARPLETCVNGNVGLIGDVGHHCDPLHGGGMMFGSRAGKSFAHAVVQNDLSIYDGLWKDAFLDTLQNRFVIRDLIYNMDNSEYDRFIASIKGFEIQGTSPDTEIPRMLWHCLKNDSGIFTKTAAQATRSAVRQRLGI